MNDNALFIVLKSVLDAGLVARGIDDVTVKQSYQPTMQGVEAGPAIYFTKLPMDRRKGWPYRSDGWNDDMTAFITTERQEYETTIQFSAMKREDPESLDELTASDLGNQAASILQSEVAMAALADEGLSVLRVGEVRSGKITNGEDQFETVPSFDLVVLHEQVTVTTTPAALVKALAVKRV